MCNFPAWTTTKANSLSSKQHHIVLFIDENINWKFHARFHVYTLTYRITTIQSNVCLRKKSSLMWLSGISKIILHINPLPPIHTPPQTQSDIFLRKLFYTPINTIWQRVFFKTALRQNVYRLHGFRTEDPINNPTTETTNMALHNANEKPALRLCTWSVLNISSVTKTHRRYWQMGKRKRLELVIQLISQIPTNQNRNLAKQKIYSSVMYVHPQNFTTLISIRRDWHKKKNLPNRISYNKW